MKVPPVKILFSEEDRKEILARIDEILTTGQLTLGKYVKKFEQKFASTVGTKHAVAVNSGTSSIEISLRILGVEGKEVLVPTNTFFATAAAVVHAGGIPRFVDIDASTFAIDIEDLERRVTKATVGVIVVHIAGIVTPRINDIIQLCRTKGLFLVEDAAHSHGSSFEGKKAGTFGRIASFSFYPTKVITSGEGGMIVTDDEYIAQEAFIYRDQGKAGFLSNYHVRMGYNWRMSELHAILGLSQLQHLEEFILDRQRIAHFYDEGLQDIRGVTPLLLPKGVYSNYYKYIALLDRGIERKKLKILLKEKYGISLSGEVYETPLHDQPVFKPYATDRLPIAEDICRRHICLPIFPGMSDEEAKYVIQSLADALREILN